MDIHVVTGRGMEGCGRGGLSVVVFCCGRAYELVVVGILADGMRFRAATCATWDHKSLARKKTCNNNVQQRRISQSVGRIWVRRRTAGRGQVTAGGERGRQGAGISLGRRSADSNKVLAGETGRRQAGGSGSEVSVLCVSASSAEWKQRCGEAENGWTRGNGGVSGFVGFGWERASEWVTDCVGRQIVRACVL